MLGHANLLIRTDGGAVLFDPLFHDEHHEGVYDVYPPRRVDIQALPDFDVVVLSHAHADHFDLPSISLLPRRIPVLVPADPDMIACLRGLGFAQVVPVEDLEPVTIGELELVPTPASAGAREHGFLVRHGGVTVWNMVDTFPSLSAIDGVLRAFGAIDVLLAPWQPLHDTGVSSGIGPQFPHRMYSRILAMIGRINPRVLVPGACGFWAIGVAAWTNAALFPLTRERFVSDLAGLDPDLAQRVLTLEPGDAITASPRGISHEQGLLNYVSTTRDYDWRDRAFRPLDLLGPPLQEHRGETASVGECEAAIQSLFEDVLPEFIAENSGAFSLHQRWQLVRQYEVVFDAGERRYWTTRFEDGGLVAAPGEDPLRTAYTVISAGLLIGLIAGSVSWEYAEMSGELRRFDFSYIVDERGLHVPQLGLADPLAALLGSQSSLEQFRANKIEALDGEYREALAKMGIDPDELLASPDDVPRSRTPLIDPTAIAASVMERINIVPKDLDTKKSEGYGSAGKSAQDEKLDPS
ncbi:putative Rieske 2Fe-2S iron-sulfur protein [Enhygromyxa salina]|uniref:Putative Rieske 2Fe-2S iron-sulfur protein n=1 Tax=Enhygromyxa salina TaxID=215803 RepID=A0A2S9YL98_9BACT|nr:MBL fold metallo-hydrolase [Enhygromyxa salina]PRQ05838.1 putative Rieske 2Fe-2S iron-sulfur protein [Enhygromyxa salina]